MAHVINSKLEEFSVIAKARLNCILKHEHELVEAADVVHNLKEVVRAFKIRLIYEAEYPTPGSLV